MPFGNLRQFLHITGSPPQMDPDDARRAGCDQVLDAVRINVIRVRINVAKDRRNLLPLQSVGGGDECH